MRRTRTEIETRRDISSAVEDRLEKFNDKGRCVYPIYSLILALIVCMLSQIYGEAWDGGNGTVPVRCWLSITYMMQVMICDQGIL